MQTKTLWIKEEYLQHILTGRKTIEIRVGYSNINKLKAGDRLLLNDRFPYIIHQINTYPSFEQMLSIENPAAIAPNVPKDELLEQIRAIYPPEKEALGVVAIHISPERKS